MQFKSIYIKNFRNFKEIDIDLKNKNIIFGRNDFGKTNFLYALRFLFDSQLRRHGLEKTDYYKREISDPVIIRVEIELGDDEDSLFLRAIMKGATSFSDKVDPENPTVYIQLKAEFIKEEQMGNPVLYWGGDETDLIEIPGRGNRTELDRVFEVSYIDPNVNPNQLYKQHRNLIFQKAESTNHKEIDDAVEKLNEVISENTIVEFIEKNLTERYNDIRKEDLKILLKSEMEVNGVFNHLIPYIQHKDEGENDTYPTSGDGRRKLLAYALTEYIQKVKEEKESGRKIQIYLVEEVENSLHPKMQDTLSRYLFNEDNIYSYLFLTTHSEHMFTYASEINLIRIYRHTEKIMSKSRFYQVPEIFKNTRKTFNLLLGQALFVDKVLLVEGMSEKILFEAVLEKLIEERYNDLDYMKLEKIEILSVEGIGFIEYIKILKKLNITPIIKTDNDVRKNGAGLQKLGINRCLDIEHVIENNKRLDDSLKEEKEPIEKDDEWDKKDKDMVYKYKRRIFKSYESKIEKWKSIGIYLSEIELEEDLIEVLEEKGLLEDVGKTKGELLEYFQSSKKNNMNVFVNRHMTFDMAKAIYEHCNFVCLKSLMGDNNEDC